MILHALHEEAFRSFKVGLASTVAVTVLAVVATVTVVQVRLLERWAHRA